MVVWGEDVGGWRRGEVGKRRAEEVGEGGALTNICSLSVGMVCVRGILFEPCRLVNIERGS